MSGLLIDGSDHLIGPLGLAQTCGCGIEATAVGDEGEFVQRLGRIRISAMEQEWQRRKRRLACRNKALAHSFPLILRIITNYSSFLALKPPPLPLT